ncbi:MAG: serine protein kinase RIO [Nanoarchaeota archaeon]|nr:serine protein kinase RIO [Nanoarchaeota archaeon]
MRKDKEKFRVFKEVFSESTMRTIYKLSSDGYIDYIIGPISTGKEANVFLGKNFDGDSIAIKIYRIETSNFNNMWKYIYGDPRFEKVKKRRRDIVFAWAKKELKNLEIAFNAGVKVPEPITSRNNVLIMSFIGDSEMPAPIAKEVPPKNPNEWLKEILDYIKKMYNANLVHGDISEYNILNFNEVPYLIDFGQGVIKEYPLAEELLRNDIKNVLKWMKKLGVKTPDFEKVYKEITKGDSRNG